MSPPHTPHESGVRAQRKSQQNPQPLHTPLPVTLLPKTCFPLAGSTANDGPLSHWELALRRGGAGQDAPSNNNHGAIGGPAYCPTSLDTRARQSGTLRGLGTVWELSVMQSGGSSWGLGSPPGVARAIAPGRWSTEKHQRHTSIAFFPRGWLSSWFFGFSENQS